MSMKIWAVSRAQWGAKFGVLMVATVLVGASMSSDLLGPGRVHAQSAAAQDQLPEAPNKSLVVAKCTQCHGADMFASHRQSESAWDETISQMVTKGLVLSDEDYDKVLKYLSTNLAPVPSTVNVNAASASELQKALDLTDKEADRIVSARAAHGNFKDWHEVAKVEGVDPKKIEAKKDLLSF
jgi:competence ComEA-like helix-hairpin-helix protein